MISVVRGFAARKLPSPAPQGPLADINTPPLIDVMLVLLIMFVITIPIATQSIDVDLPQEGRPSELPFSTVRNKVTITPQDTVTWNGHTVTRAQLAGALRQTTAMPVEPELQFEPDASASYDATAGVLSTIKAAGVTRFGFVGNERHRDFSK